MSFTRIKLNLAFAFASFCSLWAAPVLAQTGGSSGTAGSLTKADFTIYLEQYVDGEPRRMNTTEEQYFFNRARCECNGDTTKNSGAFNIVIAPSSSSAVDKIKAALTANGTTGVGKLYAGSSTGVNCLKPNSYTGGVAASCTNLMDPDNFEKSFALTDFTVSGRKKTIGPIPVAWLFNALNTPTCGSNGTCNAIDNCSRSLVSQSIYFWVQTTTTSLPDSDDNIRQVKLNGAVALAPTNVKATGGNEALMVQWDWPTGSSPSTDASFLGVQIFCVRGAGLQVFADETFGRGSFMTAGTTCSEIAPATASYGAFSQLDPKYLCSGLVSGTQEFRISGLQNEIYYGVGVAGVDKYGNVSPIDEASVYYAKPIPTVDFYTYYREKGGAAQGGYCEIVRRPGVGSAAISLGLVAVGLLLVRRIRARKRPPGGGALLLLVAAGPLAAGSAQAQAIYHDDMSEMEQAGPQEWGGSARRFAVELRFGLYRPNIDSELGGDKSPNAFIFGNKHRPMWQAEFDWEVLQAFGTLAVGGSIGYYKANAKACMKVKLDETGECERSGDSTSLRLIPLAALVIYRMDEGAKHWRIPLIPYAKFGLNYTLWTVTNGDGNVPKYPGGGRGDGGTAGWQASVGLSLQLDFLDPAASRGFDADMGVNHTYAFFELSHISGSGLYRKDVLRVGDSTWFAGLMFEF